MLFDLDQITLAVKDHLSDTEKSKEEPIGRAIAECLDDLTMNLQSVGFVKTYNVSITAGDREVTLTGDNNDLRDILYLKIQTGDSQKLLEFKPVKEFLDKYDNPSASADTPTYFTIIMGADGFPTVKVDCPWLAADTMIVYYFSDYSPQSMAKMRTGAAIIQGTLAYFWGTHTVQGANCYLHYEKLVRKAINSDPWLKHDAKIDLNKVDADVLVIAGNMRARRC